MYGDPELYRMLRKTMNVRERDRIKQVIRLRANINNKVVTKSRIKAKSAKRLYIRTESASVKLGSEGIPSVEKVDQNLIDMVGDTPADISSGNSEALQTGQKEYLEMGDFLARPIEIYSASMPLATDFDAALDVWNLFTMNPTIRAKLRNYAYLRGDLKLRIAISGTPFHYGKVLFSYQPWADYNEVSTLLTAAASLSGGRTQLLGYLSQAPGAFTMSVNENMPVDFKIPFIHLKPMARLFNAASTVLGDTTAFDDFAEMGYLIIHSINQPRSASTSATNPYIRIYAWMEDAQLGTSTGTHIQITTESGKDERVVGPVETVSTAIAGAALSLQDVPFIGSFAKASGMVASVVGRIASLFGWSKPVLIQRAVIVKNEPFQNGANVIGYDTNKRIVLDPKQEVTVDPRSAGIDFDDMVIAEIARRKSYLGGFEWTSADALMDPIFGLRVSPSLAHIVEVSTTGTIGYVMPTAMCFAAMPFTYWRGDITIRVEVVCSAFHRGKLLIFHEPNINQVALVNADLSLNKQFVRVIDIQQTQTVDFKVNWASARSWLKVSSPRGVYYNTTGLTSATDRNGFANGYIGIAPFTSLQSPLDEPVTVNIYVWCDNLQVNGLSGLNMPGERRIRTESGKLSMETPSEILCVDLNESSAEPHRISEEHFGEQPISFRALLKRYVTIGTIAVTTGANNTFSRQSSIIPVNSMPLQGTSFTYKTLFSYLRPAYLGLRGSVRRRFTLAGDPGMGVTSAVKVSLSQPTSVYAASSTTYSADPAISYTDGTVTYVPRTTGGVEVELPFYTNNLFVFSFFGDEIIPPLAGTDVFEQTFYRNFIYTQEVTTALTSKSLVTDLATGEDFSFLRFQGAVPYSYNY